MTGAVTQLTEQDLLLELARVEHAIAGSSTFTRWLDAEGRSHLGVGDDLLALAERGHAIVRELRWRRRKASTILQAAAA